MNKSTASILQRIFCRLGFHKLRKGFGWSNGKRYDFCWCCSYSRWIDDIDGYNKWNHITRSKNATLKIKLMEATNLQIFDRFQTVKYKALIAVTLFGEIVVLQDLTEYTEQQSLKEYLSDIAEKNLGYNHQFLNVALTEGYVYLVDIVVMWFKGEDNSNADAEWESELEIENIYLTIDNFAQFL